MCVFSKLLHTNTKREREDEKTKKQSLNCKFGNIYRGMDLNKELTELVKKREYDEMTETAHTGALCSVTLSKMSHC